MYSDLPPELKARIANALEDDDFWTMRSTDRRTRAALMPGPAASAAFMRTLTHLMASHHLVFVITPSNTHHARKLPRGSVLVDDMITFPTVQQALQYFASLALRAQEVGTRSTRFLSPDFNLLGEHLLQGQVASWQERLLRLADYKDLIQRPIYITLRYGTEHEDVILFSVGLWEWRIRQVEHALAALDGVLWFLNRTKPPPKLIQLMYSQVQYRAPGWDLDSPWK